MEIVILGGIVVVVVAFNLAGGLFLMARGVPTWDRQSHREAVGMAGGIVFVAACISLVWFGAGALLAAWPALVCLAVPVALAYGVSDWWSKRNERKRERVETSYDVMVWLAENDDDGIGGQRARAWLNERRR